MKNHATAGFTLTELMVVVIGLGFLASLVLPAGIRAHGCGRNQACASNLAQMWKMMTIYQSQYGGGHHRRIPLQTGGAFWRAMENTVPPSSIRLRSKSSSAL